MAAVAAAQKLPQHDVAWERAYTDLGAFNGDLTSSGDLEEAWNEDEVAGFGHPRDRHVRPKRNASFQGTLALMDSDMGAFFFELLYRPSV